MERVEKSPVDKRIIPPVDRYYQNLHKAILTEIHNSNFQDSSVPTWGCCGRYGIGRLDKCKKCGRVNPKL